MNRVESWKNKKGKGKKGLGGKLLRRLSWKMNKKASVDKTCSVRTLQDTYDELQVSTINGDDPSFYINMQTPIANP